ncbi:MAG: FAD:protein FMN transferase [candidate division WOR-3 bacterium]
MRERKFLFIFLCFSFLFPLLFILFFITLKEFTFEGFYFDTYVSGKIYVKNPIIAKNFIKDIKREFERINSLEIMGIKNGVVDTTIVTILKEALFVSKNTNGYFDPSVDPILKKWNYFKEPRIPYKEEIKALLSFVDYKKIKFKKDTLFMPEEFSINIGGAAKGYALNRAKSLFNKYGISSGLVNAGGDILVVGKKRGKKDWRIGIRHPRDYNGIIGVLKVSDCFVFTSGDYERYFMKEGKRYHHIVNPYSGYPSLGIIGATVIAKEGIKGDCIATALMAMEIEKAIEFVKKNKIEAILVDTAMNIHKFIDIKKYE